MPWYLILKSLYDYLLAANLADIMALGIPEAGSVGLEKAGQTAIYVARNHESNQDVYHGGTGKVTLEVGFFINDEGSTDFANGYLLLSNLEKAAQTVIETWASQDMPCDTVEVIKVEINEAGGNPYCARPVIGSYLSITIDWSLRAL